MINVLTHAQSIVMVTEAHVSAETGDRELLEEFSAAEVAGRWEGRGPGIPAGYITAIKAHRYTFWPSDYSLNLLQKLIFSLLLQ